MPFLLSFSLFINVVNLYSAQLSACAGDTKICESNSVLEFHNEIIKYGRKIKVAEMLGRSKWPRKGLGSKEREIMMQSVSWKNEADFKVVK